MNSFKAEIRVVNDTRFYPNGVAFETREEAEAYGRNKVAAWTMAQEYRVVESEEMPNYHWNGGRGLLAIPAPVEARESIPEIVARVCDKEDSRG
jgi:hypothetical protein